jgi:glycine/D-amino acid oxidase-like deaminating enzyme
MIAVVGGGITGAFAAYFLARRDVEVTLIERDAVAAQASGKNPGGLNPLHGPGIPGPLGELALEALRLHLEHFSPPRRPRVQLAVDDGDVEKLERSKELYDSTPGFSARWIDARELGAAMPCGLWTEGNCRVDAADYTRAVVRAAGPTLLKGEVTGLAQRNGRVVEVVLGSEAVACDAVVIATGAWCAGPASWLGLPLPVEPVEGELLLVGRSGGTRVDLAWRDAGVYGAGEDRVWLGGQRDLASRILPDLREAPVIRRTSAPRPMTPDGFPIVGLVPGLENACLAIGGGRKGMLLSSALGLAAAELLTDGRTRLPLDACSPDRCSALSASAA